MAGRLGFSRQKATGRPYVCIIIDVGMTRRASGTDLKPPTPTAGSRTRPRAASRALSVLVCALIEYQGRRVGGGTLWYERKPAPAPSRTAAPQKTTALWDSGSYTYTPTVSELQLPPTSTASCSKGSYRQPQTPLRLPQTRFYFRWVLPDAFGRLT
jgi:hypothetical protein